MKMTFRWYGEDDPVTLEKIKQIPGMNGIVSAIYDIPVGEVWPLDRIIKLKETVEKSGLSSYRYLQNVYSANHSEEQGISLALALSEKLFGDFKGTRPAVCRVHGGGFAGTMQAFVPEEDTETYRAGIDKVFGEGACMIMHVRPLGAIKIG